MNTAKLTNYKMYAYGITDTYTTSTSTATSDAISTNAKQGNGYARITVIE